MISKEFEKRKKKIQEKERKMLNKRNNTYMGRVSGNREHK